MGMMIGLCSVKYLTLFLVNWSEVILNLSV